MDSRTTLHSQPGLRPHTRPSFPVWAHPPFFRCTSPSCRDLRHLHTHGSTPVHLHTQSLLAHMTSLHILVQRLHGFVFFELQFLFL